eukprot:g28007.t1
MRSGSKRDTWRLEEPESRTSTKRQTVHGDFERPFARSPSDDEELPVISRKTSKRNTWRKDDDDEALPVITRNTSKRNTWKKDDDEAPSLSRKSSRKRTLRQSFNQETVPIDMNDMENRIHEVFEMSDKDNSGELDMLELREALFSLNPQFSVTEVAFFCKWINETGNGDGLEFMDWLKAGTPAAQELSQIIIAETGSSTAARLRDLFKRFDKAFGTERGGGRFLSAVHWPALIRMSSVFRVLMPCLTFRDIALLMKELDTGGDEKVSRMEFLAWLQKGSPKALEVKKEIIATTGIRWEQRIRRAFQTYDIDNSGLMDMGAMAMALRNLGSLTNEEVRNVCADLDKSKDHRISYAEFRAWIKNGMGSRSLGEIEKAKAILAPSDSDGLEAVFYNFCGAGKAELDGKSFMKLCEDASLVDLIFCDTRVKKKGQRTIDVVQFEVALELLAERTGVPKQDLRMEVLLKGKPDFRSSTGLQAFRKMAPATPKEGEGASARRSHTLRRLPGSLGGATPRSEKKVEASKLWQVFNRHTAAGRCLWLIYAEKPKRPKSPPTGRASPRGAPPRPSTQRRERRVSPDFSDLCVKVVLQCARSSCGFRVTEVGGSFCCQACEDQAGDQHDNTCLQVPVAGLSMDRSDRGYSDYHDFSVQLRKLLEEKGPQHIGSLPHAWDAEYGSGSWAKSRPVKSASKACNGGKGVTVLDQVVHRLEDPLEISAEEREHSQVDLARFKSFSPELIDVLTDEFDLIEPCFEVSTSIATVRAAMPVGSILDVTGGRLWCCRMKIFEVREPEIEGAEGAVFSAEAAEMGPTREERHSCAGYGRSAEHAMMMARLHILEKLERWDASDLLPRARQLEKQLQDSARELLEQAEGEETRAGSASTELPAVPLKEFLDLLESLLLKPNPKSFVVWKLLARSWPYILAFSDEDELHKLHRAMRMPSRGPSLRVWLQMAEVAAYDVQRPVLEFLEDPTRSRDRTLGAWDPIPLKVDRREQLRTFFDLDAVGNDMGDAASAGVSAAAPVVSDAAQDAASSAASAVMSGAQAAAPMVGDAASSLASNLGDAASNLGDDNGCFPAASCVLERRRGVVRMEDVRVGDELDCGGVFSPVIAMLHRSPGGIRGARHTSAGKTVRVGVEGSYVVIHFVSGAVVISRNHLIQLQEETEEGPPRFCWVPAADVRVGQQLQNGQRVISVTSAEATGLFAPLTLSSTLLVDGALCSCFAPPLEPGQQVDAVPGLGKTVSDKASAGSQPRAVPPSNGSLEGLAPSEEHFGVHHDTPVARLPAVDAGGLDAVDDERVADNSSLRSEPAVDPSIASSSPECDFNVTPRPVPTLQRQKSEG